MFLRRPTTNADPSDTRATMVVDQLSDPPGYTLQKLLGRGGMGEVYQARQRTTGQNVAIKFAIPEKSHLKRFWREFRHLQRLKHPNIVQVYAYNENFARPYFVMELLPGITLAQLAEQAPHKRLELAWVKSIFAQLAEALAYIHSEGLVHRDLKPANLMLLNSAQPAELNLKLMDFGVILPSESQRITVNPHARMGSIQYMAPEQFFTSSVTPSADLYAFGLMLYEALTGQRPFPGTESQTLIQQHTQPPPTFQRWNVTVSADLEKLVMQLLSQEPRHRPEITTVLNYFHAFSPEATPPLTLTSSLACGRCRQPQLLGAFACEECGTRLWPPLPKESLTPTPPPAGLTVTLNQPCLPSLERPQLVYLLTHWVPPPQQERLPLNFALILDRSESMKGAPLDSLKGAVNTILDQLHPNDVISIIVFSDWTKTLIKSQLTQTNQEKFKREVAKITAEGKTSLAPALREGLQQLAKYLTSERASRIVVLTDGVADDEAQASQQADAAGDKGIPIIGLGLGKHWKEDFLSDLSNRSKRSQFWMQAEEVHFIRSPEKAIAVFKEAYRSVQIVGRSAALTLLPTAGVAIRRIWEVAPRLRDLRLAETEGKPVKLAIGDLGIQGVTHLIELSVAPHLSELACLLRLQANCLLPSGAAYSEQAEALSDPTQTPIQNTRWDQKVVAVLEQVRAYVLQLQARESLEEGARELSSSQLRAAAQILHAQGQSELAYQTLHEAERVARTGQMSSEGRKTISTTSRTTRLV